MNKKRIFSIITLSIVVLPALMIYFMYQSYKNEASDQPPYWDLFIAKTFYKNEKQSPWDNISKEEKRPVKWLLNKSDFEKLDSVFIGFKNISNEKLYFVTWGYPNSRLRRDLIIYKNGKLDSIPFGGFGCGTGIFVSPAENQDIVGGYSLNPLMFNPYSNYDLPIETDSFPRVFKEIYGDSIGIRFQQATYSNPWNSYRSQMIYSEYIIISTDKIIENWKEGKFAHLPKREETMEEFYGLKKK
jgi:hypothetical protein